MVFEYDCPNCGETITGGLGDDVTCIECNNSYETDSDFSDDTFSSWIIKTNN